MHTRLHFGHLAKAMPTGRVLSQPDLLVVDSGLPLHASSDGLRVYERLGLRSVGELHEFKPQ